MRPDLPGFPDQRTPQLPRRERAAIVVSLATLTVLSWIYLRHLNAGMDMTDMSTMPDMPGMAMEHAWGAFELLLAFVMWSVMMVGMMLPGATPMILLFAGVQRRSRDSAFTTLAVFVLGYIAVWTVFSAAATGVQAGLQSARLLAMDRLTNELLSAAVLIVAGVYQWTALKERCLEHCQSPLVFMLKHWRPGLPGAWRMGVLHGTYCLGCCWALMALLFVGGVMNLLWVAALAVLVLLEKILPGGFWLARAAGIVLIGWGVARLGGLMAFI